MAQAAAKTGPVPTLIVAIEQFFPLNRRIINDDLACSILPFGARVLIRLMRPGWARDRIFRFAEKAAPGLWAGMVCRKRYIDEKLLESVDRIGAVVNLGAGFDTRVYRLQALANMRVWEIDQPENIRAKRARLRKIFGAVPDRVTLMAVDFDHEELGAALAANGFQAGNPTFFVWEAVMMYLTEPAVRSTFDFLAQAAQGSRLAFTYIRKDFIDGRVLYHQEDLYKRYVENKVWLFGMEPEGVAKFLLDYGWRLVEDFDYAALAQRYVAPTGRELTSYPVERVAFAEKL